ncbi:hypothetical protein O6H91_05G039700 [Diphasiastrum complanatum]|uniref:Uncharacterized protein n=3 Tax=Diphasiastrum complanatum TaxID=34168 RepID=A0ACC2DMT5_DIPCM|nr:hypothetical protein O6H91_05G039700 [Diphasiastrum complanatum]KAJ7555470.1 hypothetical protein O6H91_05G039700 [Diphasiastrum complanatum]KAJ7555471.1 hypothetical protein O6H91_05G039700 [Diphasiastrum complanatum]
MERKCELCPARAALYCAADEAYVCWECDSNVHGANFLVARHYRSVLCRQCSSPTVWRASGARFHPTTCLCTPCQSGNPGSCGSGKISDDSQTESAVRSSSVATSQNVRGSDPTGNEPDFNIMICSSSSQAKVKSSPSPKFAESSKMVKSSSNVGCAPESRPRSPVSVISSGRSLVKKRRMLVVEQGSIHESSSDSDPEDFSEVTDSRDSEYPSQILNFPSNWTESFLFPTTSRCRRSLIRLQNRTLDQVQGTSNYQLTVLDVRQLGPTSEARMERVFWDWHDYLNLRSPATVALAMHLLRRFSCAIKVSDRDGLDARIFLAGCFWIAIKLHNPGAVGSRSRLYELCTGIPFWVLLAAEVQIYQLLNWRIDLDGCTEGMPRWAMNDS